VPVVIRSSVHVSNATGEITAWMAGSAASARSASSSWAMLAGVNRSTTVCPSGTENSTTMLSPPNSDLVALVVAGHL
jgi:hypothetical protein